jgi:hypothetical protein
MPRVAGVHIVAVIAAAVVIYFIGFMIYGIILGEMWANENLADHGVLAHFKIPGALDMAPAMSLGFVISLVTALGLAIAQGIMKPQSIGQALRNAFVMWFGFAVTSLSYSLAYGGFSRINFGIDTLHTFLDYLAASAVIFLIDGKARSNKATASA